MKFIIPIILFVFIVGIASCKKEKLQWQKTVQLESHTTSRLNRVHFLNNHTCIIGGGEKYEKSEILLSKDGGNTWSFSSFPNVGKGMYGIGMSPSGTIYLSGFDGRVIFSENEGNSWHESQIQDWRYYIAIAYPTDDLGVYIATSAQERGTIVRVNKDLGIMDTNSYAFGLNDVVFPDKNVGYVSGYGAILKTTDGGDSWNILDVENDNFNALFAFNENDIWTCGYNGSIFHTIDGGVTWEKPRNGNKITQPRYRLLDITFKDRLNGWAVGEEGLVISTSDGGETWNKYKSFTDAALVSVAIMPDGNLLVCGEKGTLYKLYL